MADELRALRLSKKIPAKDIVAVVQKYYPAFDKTMLSKSEHCARYGVSLRRDALDALIDEFAPETREAIQHQRNGRHKLTCRIACRLEDDVYAALQQQIKADGYDTTQGWLSDMVNQYLARRSDKEPSTNERSDL
mgnify:CR=1 FL=1